MSVSSCATKHPLRLNYSVAEIGTLEGEHTALAGFAARKSLSDGIHIIPKSHCIVFADDEKKVCIISNELMEISPVLSKEIRTEISQRSGLPIDNIIMHCTHTHSAPRTGGIESREGGTNHAYKLRTFETIIANAVNTIASDAQFRPFVMKTAKAQAGINFNRCEATGPRDGSVYIARFEETDGSPIVSIINYACHPVCMGPKSLKLSSDYTGVAARVLSEVWGGELMQFTGAAGNMDPVGGPKDYLRAEELGTQLAQEIKDAEFKTVKDKSLLIMANHIAQLPYRISTITPEAVISHADEITNWEKTVSASWKGDVARWRDEILARFDKGMISDSLAFEMEAVNINGIVFFFSQGEPFVEYQQEARENFPGKTIFFAGYTNGQNSYLPSQHAFEVKKGYEYEIDQMHIYIKAPYPLSDQMPAEYSGAVHSTISHVIK